MSIWKYTKARKEVATEKIDNILTLFASGAARNFILTTAPLLN